MNSSINEYYDYFSGTSFGGFSTMNALELTPDKFQCGIEINGPMNLVLFLESEKGGRLHAFVRLIKADVRTEAGNLCTLVL